MPRHDDHPRAETHSESNDKNDHAGVKRVHLSIPQILIIILVLVITYMILGRANFITTAYGLLTLWFASFIVGSIVAVIEIITKWGKPIHRDLSV